MSDWLDLSDQITLWIAKPSSCSSRARLALAVKKIKVTLKVVSTDNFPDDFVKMNPSKSVPVMILNMPEYQGMLTQSMAIMEFIEEVWPERGLGRMLPGDAVQRAVVRGLCQMVIADIQPRHGRNILRKIDSVGGNSKEWPKELHTQSLPTIEQQLALSAYHNADSGFCFFDKLTLADIALWPLLWNCERFQVDKQTLFAQSRNLEKVWNNMSNLEDASKNPDDPVSQALQHAR